MRPIQNRRLEIAAHTIDAALAAMAGGADRVEFFSNNPEGGLTPSHGAIAIVREKLSIELNTMIRPRGGDFLYSDIEFEAMLRDINDAKQLGVDGVVFGVLNRDGTVNMSRTRALIEAARPLSVTFHRAFDMCCDLPNALEDLISCGVDRVLTSGGEPSSVEGMTMLRRLTDLAGTRIVVMAGGGMRPDNVADIVGQTGVHEVHAGLRSKVPSPMQFRNEKIIFGTSGVGEYERVVVKESDVRALANALKSL